MTTWDNDVYSVAVNLDQGTMEQPRLEVQRFRGLNRFPEWSRDGRYLAYVSGRPDSKSYLISIRDEETGKEREIRPKLASFEYIRWSPDGQSFLAAGQDTENHGGLFLIDAQTGSARSLLEGDPVKGVLLFAQWLPDGRRILYAQNSRQPQMLARIAVRDLETGNEQEILRMADQRLIGFVALSPDGTRLAFTAWRLQGSVLQNTTLTLMPASGGQGTELFQVKFPEMIANLAWSNDSRSVLFVRGNLGGQQSRQGLRPLWQIPAAGGQPRQIGALVDEGQINILSLHPNGRRIAYTRSSREFEIWAMEGLLAAASPE